MGGGRVSIGYEVTEGSNFPIGFGFDISLNNESTFSSVVWANDSFPIYPGTIDIDGISGEISDYGSPVAPPNPGSLGGLGTSGVTIEMGVMMTMREGIGDPGDLNYDGIVDLLDMALFVENWLVGFDESSDRNLILSSMMKIPDINGDGEVDFVDYCLFAQGDDVAMSGELVVLQLDGNGALTTTISIFGNSIRGGVVADNAVGFNVILPEPVTVIIPEPWTVLLFGLGGLMLRRKR